MLLQGKRIFIIEDDLANRAIAQTLLETHGARTSFERWGTESVEKLRKFMPVDIILLDLMFPNEITGYDVFDAIRVHAEFDDIPIAAVSASDPLTAISKTKAQGFSGFIAKPIHVTTFPRLVAKLINREEVWHRG